MTTTTTTRSGWAWRALAASVLVALIATAPGVAGASVPAPGEAVTPNPAGGVAEVFGTNATGDTFYNAPGSPPVGRVRHADGTVTQLGRTLEGTGEVGPDGHLWIGEGGEVLSIAPDGTTAAFPLTSPTATDVVRFGVDGRLWFLDRVGHRVGAMALDGTGEVSWPLPASGSLQQLSPSPDGRMWVSATKGQHSAITPAGVVTTYQVFDRQTLGLVANAAGLYAVTSKGLFRISGSGKPTAVATPVFVPTAATSTAESGGWIWVSSGSAITTISPSARITQFSVERTFYAPYGQVLPSVVRLAPDERGGFTSIQDTSLIRYPDPQIDEQLSASGTVFASKGANVLRSSARVRTPGGRSLSGTVQLELWWSERVPWGFERARIAKIALGSATLVDGRASIDTVLTPAFTKQIPQLGDPRGIVNCCWLVARRPGTAAGPGLASPGGGIGGLALYPSSTMRYLDDVSLRTTGRSMDSAGIRYWAEKLASGTSRSVPVQQLVGSARWREHEIAAIYERWLLRKPTASETSYWAGRLASGRSTDVELAIAGTSAARDATGASNGARAAHLTTALWMPTSYRDGLRAKLDAGASWSSVVKGAHWSAAATEARMLRLAPSSAFSPTLASLGSEWARTGDVRGPLVRALATMPAPQSPYDY